MTDEGTCGTVAEDAVRISGCEFEGPFDEAIANEQCDDAIDREICIRDFLSAYTCEPLNYEPINEEQAELFKLPGVCVPNPNNQGRPCIPGVPILSFCGFGVDGLPDGQCVESGGPVLEGFCRIEEFCEFDPFGRGCLSGSAFAHFEDVRPDTLFGQFNVLPDNNTAGSDLVLINFADNYVPFNVLPGYVFIDKNIHDDQENPLSCGNDTVCYARYGVDEPIVIAEEFVPPTLPPTPTPTMGPPTGTPPPTLPPTPTPTSTNGPSGGGSSSCAIAGSPVQLGTALANVLIPLVPVAFAFGVRAVRRRKK
jgi:hypothetical protein